MSSIELIVGFAVMAARSFCVGYPMWIVLRYAGVEYPALWAMCTGVWVSAVTFHRAVYVMAMIIDPVRWVREEREDYRRERAVEDMRGH